MINIRDETLSNLEFNSLHDAIVSNILSDKESRTVQLELKLISNFEIPAEEDSGYELEWKKGVLSFKGVTCFEINIDASEGEIILNKVVALSKKNRFGNTFKNWKLDCHQGEIVIFADEASFMIL